MTDLTHMSANNSNLIGFRPMLSATLSDLSISSLDYPQLVSHKLDGIRVCCHPSLGPVTRTLKKVPNKYIRSILSHPRLYYLDGEVVVGEYNTPGLMGRTQSGVMSEDGTPDFTYYVFDSFYSPNSIYRLRFIAAKEIIEEYNVVDDGFVRRVIILNQSAVMDPTELRMLEEWSVQDGFEGLMVRHPEAPYKFGRSTLRQQFLMKLKRFEDAEAIITGFEALEKNTNLPAKDLLGLQKRSSHTAGMVAQDTLGKVHVKADPWGEFSIGSGFDEALRKEIWTHQKQYLGQTVSFKYQPYGTVDKPRQPIFRSFRLD